MERKRKNYLFEKNTIFIAKDVDFDLPYLFFNEPRACKGCYIGDCVSLSNMILKKLGLELDEGQMLRLEIRAKISKKDISGKRLRY